MEEEELLQKREEKEEWRNNGGAADGGVAEVMRVLVVDDSPVERRMAESLLKNSGAVFQVTAVDSGKRAMEVLGLTESSTAEEQKIDIILTDYCMPEMTGFDLLKAVKERSCHKHIPVIIMSSENEPLRISRCRDIGAEDFIIKPLQMDDVLRVLSFARPCAVLPETNATKGRVIVELMVKLAATPPAGMAAEEQDREEEERAIKERPFYLHSLRRSRKMAAAPEPQPLFPLTSPSPQYSKQSEADGIRGKAD